MRSTQAEQIVILGAGEQGKIIAHILRLDKHEQVIFLDDHKSGPFIAGRLDQYTTYPSDKTVYFVAFGENILRSQWYTKLKSDGCKFINVIHPTSVIERGVILGDNLMIGAFAYINIGSRIGNNVIVNTRAVVEHDNVLDDHVHIAPGVITAGGVRIQEHAFVGMGSVIIDNVAIANHTIIAAGSTVIKNTLSHTLYAGSPAKAKRSLL